MIIVNLIGGNRRSPKKGQSNMREGSLQRLTRRPILAGHVAEIRSWRTERKTIPVVIGSHADEAAASTDVSFKVVNM